MTSSEDLKVSIVTPSLNQAAYLESTIRSVVDQDYDGIEYIIVDGGSTDGSIDVIRRYEDYLAYWSSESDTGQSDAICKGFGRATGDIFAWINSDDMYEPGAIRRAVEVFRHNPSSVLVYGDYYLLYPNGARLLKRKISFDYSVCLYSYLMVPQPSAFWRREAYQDLGGLSRDLHYAMDYDLFLRFARRHGEKNIQHVREPLSTYRLHMESKTMSHVADFKRECREVRSRLTNEPSAILWLKKKLYLARAEYKFITERGCLPLRKDRSKA
jgi:glycosyltransferase involved in cell wall biosynthesis